MSMAIIPAQLRPSQPDDLIRVGSVRDGGYLISRADILASDGLISMGIDNNWQFERRFHQSSRVPVHAYDGCTAPCYLLQDTREAIRHRNGRWLLRSLATFADYFRFFRGQSRHHFREFVGTDQFAYRQARSATVGLDEVFSRMPGRVFLKIDIEGAEYLLLDDLIAKAHLTTGLAIEFHDCGKRIADIVGFVERYPLTLAHLHANNYSSLNENHVPEALELTFSSSATPSRGEATLPHPLDAANTDRSEIRVIFTQ